MKYHAKYFFATAVIMVVLFFCLPHNYDWFFGNILSPPVSYAEQARQLDPDERRLLRYGRSYAFYMDMTKVFSSENKDTIIILLPPANRLKRLGIDFDVVEPAEFYYYTGYKAVWANSPDAARANFVLVPYKNWVMPRTIHGNEDRNYLIKLYKPDIPL